jgi:hypothetical protein
MEKLKRVVIKEELVKLTGDYKKAIILNQFIYWSERVNDFDKFIQEERRRMEENGEELNMELQNGWIYKSLEELSEETMIDLSPSNIRTHVKELVKNGWLSERTNPKFLWDRTKQYRVNIVKIQNDLHKLGFSLEGYPLTVEFAHFLKQKMDSDKTENAFSKTENEADQGFEASSADECESPIFRNRKCIFRNEKSIFQNRKAIPEITTEITLQKNNNNKKVHSTLKGTVPNEIVVINDKENCDKDKPDWASNDRPNETVEENIIETDINCQKLDSNLIKNDSISEQNGKNYDIYRSKSGYNTPARNYKKDFFNTNELQDAIKGNVIAKNVIIPDEGNCNNTVFCNSEATVHDINKIKESCIRFAEITGRRNDKFIISASQKYPVETLAKQLEILAEYSKHHFVENPEGFITEALKQGYQPSKELKKPKKVTCPHCNGEGFHYNFETNTAAICSVCGGSGKIVEKPCALATTVGNL